MNRYGFRVALDNSMFRDQGFIAALLVANFRSDFLHLYKACRRYRMRCSDTNAVGIFHCEGPPEVFCSREIVAGPAT